ncbi:hypothetical protein FH972_025874 [Carpinus fangiana]|uniref:Rhodopsin domain-containing protein n=1 Tax=Carpinus fangiana TaxID=176857 RepID=A0A5N6L399_9ROSI|nr:hypothetical protein FH972_025874 [Carpinus fangiana]
MNTFSARDALPHVESRAAVVLAVTAAMIAASTVFVFFRLVSRIGIVKKVTPDDYFIIVAWIISFGLSFAICLGTKYGLGMHERDISPDHKYVLIRLEYTFSVLYNPALMATKTSILVFYLTIAKTMKVFKWSTWGVLFIVNAGGLALSFLNIFQCRPLSILFSDPKPDSATCFDIVTLYLSSAPLNIMTDLCILLLPMPVLKSMRLPRKQKIILYITFGFGVFVTAVDVVRISNLQSAALTRLHDIQTGRSDASNSSSSRNQEENDYSWYASLAFMWSAIEVNVGIMCACVPALKPLVTRFLPRWISDSSRSSVLEKSTLESGEMAAMHRIPSAPFPPQSTGQPAKTGPDAELDMMDFLTTPDSAHIPIGGSRLDRTDTVETNISGLTHRSPGQYFDFVNMRGEKSLVHLTARESIKPIAIITVVFFLWGFAYGLLNTLNSQFQLIAMMSSSQSIGIHSAYFAGYFVAPITFGRLILKKWGFKACLMIGFMIYGTGTLIFWPAAVLTSFPAFLISNFIVGLGLSTLEIGANPFTVLCGPPEYSEMRLQLSQAFQACGTVVSPLLAKKALFNNVTDASSLIDVQWTYLAISLFVYILAFVYYVIKMPDATDEELEEAAATRFPPAAAYLRKTNIIWWTLGAGVFAQFLYVGAQECIATSMGYYIDQIGQIADGTLDDEPSYEAVAHTLFAVSRFISAGLGFWIKPRHQLLFWIVGAVVFSALSMNFSGLTSAVMLLMVFFFEGPIFSLVYAIPLRALGKHTRDGAALLTSAIGGGAVFPPIMHAVAAANAAYYAVPTGTSNATTNSSGSAEVTTNPGYQYAFCVVVAIFAFASIFPFYLNSVPNAKKQVDPTDPHGETRRYSSAAMTSSIKKMRSNLPRRRKTLESNGTGSDGHASEDSNPERRESLAL